MCNAGFIFRQFWDGRAVMLEDQTLEPIRNPGGNSYQKLGAAAAYYGDDRPVGPYDTGVMERPGRECDRHLLRVPGLHGVATTSPYFHDGSVAMLEDANVKMAEHQLGRPRNQQDSEDIEALLRSLGAVGACQGRHCLDQASVTLIGCPCRVSSCGAVSPEINLIRIFT